MYTIEGHKTNSQRLVEAFKTIKKKMVGFRPVPDMRPSEFMMLHSLLMCLCKQKHHAERKPADTMDEAPGVTMSELSEFMQQTPSAVSQLMKALEEKQLVERTVSPTDRRLVYVRLSEKGQAFVNKAEESLFARIDKITDALGEEDTNQLIAMLEKLMNVLDVIKDEAEQEKSE